MPGEGIGRGRAILHGSVSALAAATSGAEGCHVGVVSDRTVREWYELIADGTAERYHVVTVGGEFRNPQADGPVATKQIRPGVQVTTAGEPVEESWTAALEVALADAKEAVVAMENPSFLLAGDAPASRLAELSAIADRAAVHIAVPEPSVSVGRLARFAEASDRETTERLADDGVAHLRMADPTNFGYLRSNWREARRGLDAVEMTYPQSKQVHDAIPNPETTPRTLGAALQGFVELGALDVWGDTVAANRYDMTAYDPERAAAVGAAIERLAD